MATSSITANFEMKDAKIARAFVNALLSGRPNRKIPRHNPACRQCQERMTSRRSSAIRFAFERHEDGRVAGSGQGVWRGCG